MGKPVSSTEVFVRAYQEITANGRSATHAGEQRRREGQKIHEYVDPKGNGVIRVSKTWLEPNSDGTFYVLRGTAMLEETRVDSTDSMEKNLEISMSVLPKTHKLLSVGPRAILKRYDVQTISSIFGDIQDNYVLYRSQAETDEKIAQQMSYMVPEGQGGDPTEDPQYGLFGAAKLTYATIKELGLKSYDFTITDADARNYVSLETLKRVFGPDVIQKVRDNGHEIDENELPSTKEIVRDLLKTTHAFVLLIGSSNSKYWIDIFGPERVILITETKLLPEIKAAIIGLTEGVLELSTVEQFLIEEANLSPHQAAEIKRAVACVPMGAQAILENFDKIPMKGDIFASKTDLWPIKKADEADIASSNSIWK